MKTKPYLIGLTGSIGMGKTTTAEMFTANGVPVWDADAAVHRLYKKSGAAVAPIRALFPDVVHDGTVDRSALKNRIAVDRTALSKIEKIVHPLVAADRRAFIRRTDAPIAVLDIPLLFETGAQHDVDAVVVVTVSPAKQKARVLARQRMTPEIFETILAKQLPDGEKRARADYVITTDTLEKAHDRVRAILADINRKLPHA